MPIVDAQVHIWGADTPERPWPPGQAHRAHRPQPFSKDDLLAAMAAAGVDRAVIVPPSWEGDRNDLALAAAQAHRALGKTVRVLEASARVGGLISSELHQGFVLEHGADGLLATEPHVSSVLASHGLEDDVVVDGPARRRGGPLSTATGSPATGRRSPS